MHIEKIQIPATHSLMEDYLFHFEKVSSFYTYAPYEKESWVERKSWLDGLPFSHRDLLVSGLLDYNKQIGNDKNALDHIEKLAMDKAYVVIGGQQAGVLTGPLYAIHKAITILQLAQQKEKELGTPVVPVFWIAGEDHDFDEVNHVYLQAQKDGAKKIRLHDAPEGRVSISHFSLEEGSLENFINEFFSGQIETEYTEDLKKKLYGFAAQSQTLTDFFARIMAWLFGEKGLVLIDSTLPFLRQLEKENFRELIIRNHELQEAFIHQSGELARAGYHRQVETDPRHAQFFLYEEGKRAGVLRKEDGTFQTQDGKYTFSEEELLQLLEEDPEKFSANVVSRPFMQERIFPTLAFVGGPGEIAYWGLYRGYFGAFGMELPILVPRLTFSLLEGTVQKNMRKYGLELSDLLGRHLDEKKEEILRSLQTFHFDEAFTKVRGEFCQIYRELIQQAEEMDGGLKKIGEKNLEKILEQVGYFEKKTGEAFLKKNEALLRQFEKIRQSLYPMDKPQERVYNIFGFLNKYGMDWFEDFINYPYEITPLHTIVFIGE